MCGSLQFVTVSVSNEQVGLEIRESRTTNSGEPAAGLEFTFAISPHGVT